MHKEIILRKDTKEKLQDKQHKTMSKLKNGDMGWNVGENV